MTSTPSPTAFPAPAPAGTKPHFRTDVQGLRAVAVMLVVLYHGGLSLLPGGYVGVDVFFVISGFLITGLLIRELSSTGTVSLVDFYARRARRILPAALTVLVLTVLACVLWLSQTRWNGVGWDALGAAFSVVNWQFALGSTDYLQQDAPPSPVQHYWSLAVEEQFYLIWPVLLMISAVGITALAAQFRPGRTGSWRRPSHRVICTRILVVSLLVIVVSLMHSISLTSDNPGAAYFVTTTRMWELAVGAALAALLPLLHALPATLRGAIGWGGLAAVVLSALILHSGTPFPGAAALLPVLGSAAVILAGSGHEHVPWAPTRYLSVRPMRFLGDISFSLYLVHWPILVIVSASVFDDEMPAIAGIPLALLTIIPAWLCYRFVERPFMRWRFVAPRRVALWTGAAGMATAGLTALALVVVPPLLRTSTEPVAEGERVGAEVLLDDPAAGVPADQVEAIRPAPADAAEDRPQSSLDGCHQGFEETEPRHCTYGVTDAETTLVLIGDSHAGHWLPALQSAAQEHGWRIHTITKAACTPLATPVPRRVNGVETDYTECREWGANTVAAVQELDPDLVVVGASKYTPGDDRPVAQGLAQAWTAFTDTGLDLVVLNDVPRPGIEIPECIEENPGELTRCAVPREEAVANSGAPSIAEAARLHGDVEVLDFTDSICPAEQCAAVIGGVMVYSDSHHLTATYSATLGPELGRALAERLSRDG